MPEHKTPAVFDFDAIRDSIGERDAVVETAPPEPPSLAELIAAERAAWDPAGKATEKADLAWFAWREGHPDEDMPPEIAALYEAAEPLTEAVWPLTLRILKWVPQSIAEVILLLEHEVDFMGEARIYDNLLAGLRAIAARETPCTALLTPGVPDPAEPGDALAAGRMRSRGGYQFWLARLVEGR